MPTFLIVGASRGLGFAWLNFLCKDPTNTVIGLVRDKETARQRLVAADITESIHLVRGDITDLTSLRACAEEIKGITGRSLDVIINNATSIGSISSFRSMAEVEPEVLLDELNETFQASVIGTANLIIAFLPLLKQGQQKKFVGVSSLLADMELNDELKFDHAGPYAVSKVAMNALITKYHVAIGVPENILFMSISPGIAATSERIPDEKEVAKRAEVKEKVQQYAPHFTKSQKPAQSVEMQWKVIEGATVETHGGKFVSHTGTSLWL